MKKIISFSFFILMSNAYSASWKKVTTISAGVGTGTAGTVLTSAQCPAGYILIPKNTIYVASDFCVMKYEAKNDGYSNAVSVPTGTPWVSMTRDVKRNKCKTLGAGYDLISNNQWQTIARSIAGTASNWSSGVVANGQLNRGHTDNVPAGAIAASADDNDACFGTGQTCSSSVWSAQRRTNTLSNGNIIWDFGGNVREIVTLDISVAETAATLIIATLSTTWAAGQEKYGADSSTVCASPSVLPYCGMGSGWFYYANGLVLRGGFWSQNENGAIFTYIPSAPASADPQDGFRCVYAP